MASLNLVPNPAIMAIEAGIFLVNLVAVKKLILEPYLKVYSERVKLTKGGQEQALALSLENEKAYQTIHHTLQAAVDNGRAERDEIIGKAKKQRDHLVDSASREAQDTIADMRKLLTQEIEAHKAQLPQIAGDITRQLIDKLVPAIAKY